MPILVLVTPLGNLAENYTLGVVTLHKAKFYVE